MHIPDRILIVGGGVASFAAGIELRDRFPNADISILSAADERMLGGHLASWNDHGYPVEHGLHALFGFYQHALPMLERVGALKNFTKSHRHTFVYEHGQLHRFSFRSWLATYTGFSMRERLQLAAFLPRSMRIVRELEEGGAAALQALDAFDLRDYARKQGVPASVVDSNFFRQLYDPAFNGPHAFSAAVGAQSLHKLFKQPWHYYFNGPSRDCLIEPLRNYFVDVCRGSVLLGQKLEAVRCDEHGTTVQHLLVRDATTQALREVHADAYVLALGLEDFKQVDFGAASSLPYFRNIHQLETVSSMALQAWFADDPVPAHVDSVIGGLPRPLSIVCPVSRVRKTGCDTSLPFPYELVGTGPDDGCEDVSDEEVANAFFATLRGCGFRIPHDRSRMRVVVRRNHEPFHRYMLTRPGDLTLRPRVHSPLDNLWLGGAWVRNDLTLPSVEAATQSGIAIAQNMMARIEAHTSALRSRTFCGMPRSSPLVLPPPYHFPRSKGASFIVDANPEAVKAALPLSLRTVEGAHDKLVIVIVEHADVHGDSDPSGATYTYNEVLVAALVRQRNKKVLENPVGLFPLYLYVDDDAAMAAGREVYGFPKKMAHIQLSPTTGFTVSRKGRAPGAGKGPAEPITLLRGTWQAGDEKSVGNVSQALLRTPFTQGLMPPFYNMREIPEPHTQAGSAAWLSQLTQVQPHDVRVTHMRGLTNARLHVATSMNDEIYLLTPDATRTFSASYGVCVDFSFAFGTARIPDKEGLSA